MTSTGINVGLTDGTRSSSRVLRPPGGGHTNIFGGDDPDLKVRKDHGRNASSILEGTNTQPPEVQPAPAKAPPPEPTPIPQGESAPPQQSRARQPPGGYSSGLW